MNIENCLTYYNHSKVFHDEIIMEAVAEACRRDLPNISVDSPLLKGSDACLWIEIRRLCSDADADQLSVELSECLSILIATFCTNRRDDLDAETFGKLTNESILPAVAAKAAVKLMEAECVLLPSASNAKQLSNLQTRCVASLANSWEELDVPGIQTALSSLNPILLTNVLCEAFEQSRQKALQSELALRSVVVVGAGSPAVNGAYVFEGQHEGACRYTKKGEYNGIPASFNLCVCPTYDDVKYWFISIVQPGNTPGSSEDIDFYAAPMSRTSDLIPPRDGWVRCIGEAREAEDPPPTISSLQT